jgi:hypothetical protein
MIVVRDVFQLKFGKTKEAIALSKEGFAIIKKAGYNPSRALVDFTGRYYTLVLESEYTSLSEYEDRILDTQANAEWGKWYQKFVPLIETGYREIMRVVD